MIIMNRLSIGFFNIQNVTCLIHLTICSVITCLSRNSGSCCLPYKIQRKSFRLKSLEQFSLTCSSKGKPYKTRLQRTICFRVGWVSHLWLYSLKSHHQNLAAECKKFNCSKRTSSSTLKKGCFSTLGTLAHIFFPLMFFRIVIKV